jgi:hypothetical protein
MIPNATFNANRHFELRYQSLFNECRGLAFPSCWASRLRLRLACIEVYGSRYHRRHRAAI